jgi:clan AA aspartic protease
MIEGTIRETGTPILALKVIGKEGVEVSLEGILDTGFDGFLCLPIPVAVSLGLELIDATDTELADGSVVEDDLVFAGRAEWDGTIMDIEILLTRAADVLIGTSFLKGYIVQLDYRANTVRIEKAPQR